MALKEVVGTLMDKLSKTTSSGLELNTPEYTRRLLSHGCKYGVLHFMYG